MEIKNIYNSRWFWSLILLYGLGTIASAYILQISEDLKPCFLCILQRISYILVVIGSLLVIVKPYSSKTRIAGLILTWFGLLSGVVASIRHMYIQAHPIESFSCGPSVNFILDNNKFFDALPKLFKATGECQTIDWTLLGMTIPQISLLSFVFLIAALLIVKFLARK